MKRLKISNSELRTFKSCRRRWYLTYYRELGVPQEAERPTGALQLGTRVHAALQAMYEEKRNGLTVLNEIYEGELERFADDPYALDDLRKEWDLAQAMIEGYIEWLSESGADSGYDIVEVEQAIEVPFGTIGGHEISLRGKLDARVQRHSDGARLFLDHKTVGNFTEPLKILHLDEQMRFYHLLETLDAKYRTGSEAPTPTDGGLYNMLRKVKRTVRAKPPFYEREEVRHNRTEVQNMWKRVYGVIEDLVAVRVDLDDGEKDTHQRVAYPNPGRECTYMCPFISVCPLMDDGSDWETMLKAEFVHRDPHERYAEKGAE